MILISRKPRFDPFTAGAGAAVLSVIAVGFFFVGIRALTTGCVGLVRGRHGPSLAYCAPETAYGVATVVLLLLATVLALVSLWLLRLARRRSDTRSPSR